MNSDKNQSLAWASSEFENANMGDDRLKVRLIRIADRLGSMPESPINQACNGWAETKGAYRFFQNESVDSKEILATHAARTAQRANDFDIILAIQDTSYFSYTDHKKTTGLGVISKTPGKNVASMSSVGLIMHTSFAVSTEGLPLGILDQKIFPRPTLPEDLVELKKRSHNTNVAIEDKESFRWLESLEKTKNAMLGSGTKVVTVCDREGDFYEFFERAKTLDTSFLVRARADRTVNKPSRYAEQEVEKLWAHIGNLSVQGSIEVEIPARDNKPARVACLDIRYGSIRISPPRNHIRHKSETMPDLQLTAVYAVEPNPPPEEKEPLEWMLLTDLPVVTFDEAVEKIKWYCLRWRIEVFHKILKSGLKVEQCRLQTADRLIRYLTIMSIIAWRIYWINLLARTNPDLPCSTILCEEEWKVLYAKIHGAKKEPPAQAPKIGDVVRWIAMLGGFLARKNDGQPGVITLWRGWKRLFDLTEGWNLAKGLNETCG